MPLTPPETAIALHLQAAIANPDEANLRQLLAELEHVVGHLPQATQLVIAGSLLTQVVEVYVRRANRLLASWEERYQSDPTEPVLTAEMLHEVLRQTITLHLDDVLEDYVSSPRQSQPAVEDDSIAATVDKENVLEMLEAIAEAEAKQKALSVAHAEDMSAWANAIAQWMQQQNRPIVPFLELQRSLEMPMVEVWLGILFGGYPLEQRGEFYQSETVWVSEIVK